tara:strand:- start:1862 stop:2515 length:654 start_codon:yes stop_codon:yes gene_type:complete
MCYSCDSVCRWQQYHWLVANPKKIGTYLNLNLQGRFMLTEQKLIEIGGALCTLGKQVQKTIIEDTKQISIPFDSIRLDQPIEELADLAGWTGSRTKAQYLYRMTVSDAKLLPELRSAFASAKAQKDDGRAYARLQEESETLYVGSSKSLMSRIKQHLGLGPKRTYAMQISHWLPDTPGLLYIQAWRFSDDTPPSVVQAIEDGLWSMTKPMFGRQGAR